MTNPAPSTSQVIRFDVYELDLRAGELRKHGTRIRLQEQPFVVLRMLLENPGQIVTREELIKQIWPGDTFVDFDHGLHSAMNRLREALSDSADNPRFIETLSRRGYRFIGDIRQTAPRPPESVTGATGEETKERKSSISRKWLLLSAGLIVAALAAVLIAIFVGESPNHNPRAPSFRSLAVLPLVNLTSDPAQDYFADGMTEDLITQLSKFGDLKVTSHTSVVQYKGTHKRLPQIASELNVDAVVEGSVQLAGDHVRITAQLVDARADQHIWADTYDRELSNVLVLQSEVARDIAEKIDLKLTPQQKQRLQAEAHRVDPEAYQSYLLGRYYWNKRTADGLAKAAQYFQQTIQKDPNYALAYSGLSDYYAFLTLLGGPEILSPSASMPKAKAAAARAVQLDDTSAEAHASMGHVLHNYDWDWIGAEREFRRAIELNPNYAVAHHWYAHYLMQVGRTDESLAEARRAQEIDPFSPVINQGLARQYYLSRQYDKAIAQCKVGLQIDPTYLPAKIQLALAYEQVGKLEEAITELQQARDMAAEYATTGNSSKPSKADAKSDLPVVHALLAYAYARGGRKKDATMESNLLKALATQRYVPPSYFAVASLALGDKDQAIAWLNKSYQDRSEQMLYLGVEPIVDPLRPDPRFDFLLHRVGLKQ